MEYGEYGVMSYIPSAIWLCLKNVSHGRTCLLCGFDAAGGIVQMWEAALMFSHTEDGECHCLKGCPMNCWSQVRSFFSVADLHHPI